MAISLSKGGNVNLSKETQNLNWYRPNSHAHGEIEFKAAV